MDYVQERPAYSVVGSLLFYSPFNKTFGPEKDRFRSLMQTVAVDHSVTHSVQVLTLALKPHGPIESVAAASEPAIHRVTAAIG